MRKLLLVGLTCFSVCGWATQLQDSFIEQMDSDDDGYINLREAVKNTDLLRAFGTIDINEDGKISEQELITSDYGREVLSIPV